MNRHVRSRRLWGGRALIGAGILVPLAGLLVPLPDFEDLVPGEGRVVEALREAVPCRSGDCRRTMVTVRLGDDVRAYHFGDADPEQVRAGAPIRVWTYPEFRLGTRERLWHAEQDGRVIRDHATLVATDRRLRLLLFLSAVPALAFGVLFIRMARRSAVPADRP